MGHLEGERNKKIKERERERGRIENHNAYVLEMSVSMYMYIPVHAFLSCAAVPKVYVVWKPVSNHLHVLHQELDW